MHSQALLVSCYFPTRTVVVAVVPSDPLCTWLAAQELSTIDKTARGRDYLLAFNATLRKLNPLGWDVTTAELLVDVDLPSECIECLSFVCSFVRARSFVSVFFDGPPCVPCVVTRASPATPHQPHTYTHTTHAHTHAHTHLH